MFPLTELPYNASSPEIVWILYCVAAALYVAPTIIGFIRNVEYKWTLYFGNLLLGWTGIGWAYAAFYAVFADHAGTARQRFALAH